MHSDIDTSMQGMILIEDTGWGTDHWTTTHGRFPFFNGSDDQRVEFNRSVYRLARQNSVVGWDDDVGWGGTKIITEDDGYAIISVRDKSHSHNNIRALIFATSEAFWVKVVLKYKGQG